MERWWTPVQQFAEPNQANIDTAVRFARISLESAERLMKLQLEAAKAVLEENAKNAREISTIKDVNDVVALRAKLAEGGLEQALNYSRNMYEVASQTQSELGQLFEEAVAAVNRNLIEVMDRVANNAPAGSQLPWLRWNQP